jgi:hypothetical protein
LPLSWNEIRDRAVRFSREWKEESSENAEAKSFWDAFFDVFGMTRRRLAAFEEPVKRLRDGGKTSTGYIDLFWKGQLLVEHKSRGKDLDRAYGQAVDYFPGIAEGDLPRYILVSDFARLRLYDLEDDQQWEFPLSELHKHIRLFGFIAGYQTHPVRPQDPVNVKAAERMGVLHDLLKESGYKGHELELFLVRLLFCLFADGTGIFPAQYFRDWIESDTSPDGRDLGAKLAHLFDVMNTREAQRHRTLDERMQAFPYVNGRLFEERLAIPSFDSTMRNSLLDACRLHWGRISPAIFGALFQSIMDGKERRNLGAHYTSEENILKVIEPLFLDELRAEFERIKRSPNKLFEFQQKLRSLTFLDPACGCGNFLVVAYRELRLLELDVLRAVAKTKQSYLDILRLVQVNVDQFYGIEIEEFPAQIAQVALWLTDHQMNQRVSEEFGLYFARLPLVTSPTIVHGNALRLDWEKVIPKEHLNYILGNPPFVGHHYQTTEQKEDQAFVLQEISARGVLDFVSNWYVKAANYMAGGKHVRAAFVSTSSITQGEQVGLLWSLLLHKGIFINFAHRTFAWSSDARGAAAVHCVIIGFGYQENSEKFIFHYENVRGKPHRIHANNINPYLVDALSVVLDTRGEPISPVPRMLWGNKPTDGGHLILSPEERLDLLAKDPEAEKFVRRYMSGGDFIKGEERYCLWLVDASPQELRRHPDIKERVEKVKAFRLASKAASTREYAKHPSRFRQIAQPNSDYLAIPEVSSERRSYIPIAFLSKDIICSNKIQFIPDATPYHLGILHSEMHMAWVRAVCGRLKSDFSYSSTIVYNNFPWPTTPSGKQREAIEEAAQGVLEARQEFPMSSLADLYDPLTMPAALIKAHQRLDRIVDAAYGYKGGKNDAERVAFLFGLYEKYTSLFSTAASRPKRRFATSPGRKQVPSKQR